MNNKFMVYAEGETHEDDIEISCNDIKDMDKYAKACNKQGYKNVRTKARPITYKNDFLCPRCKRPLYDREKCFCGQEIEWGK